MTFERINLHSADQALKLVNEALADKQTQRAFSRIRNIDLALRGILNSEYRGHEVPFETPVTLRQLVVFLRSWHWFFHFGIESTDIEDVLSEALKVIPVVLAQEISLPEELTWDDEDSLLETELRKNPAIEAFLKMARTRFDEISHTDKYKAGRNRDFISE